MAGVCDGVQFGEDKEGCWASGGGMHSTECHPVSDLNGLDGHCDRL